MKTILFPTDFSPNADNALKYAVALCEAMKAKLILFNSSHIPAFASQVPVETITERKIYDLASERLQEYRQTDSLLGKNIDVEQMVAFGLAADNIVYHANEKKVDMVVMGTKGASGLQEIFLGSITASVMENAACAVLAVPATASFNGIRKIVFATDYRDHDTESINFLSAIASVFDVTIVIVHVSDITASDEYERDLFKMFKEKVIAEVAYKNISFDHITGVGVAKTLGLYDEENKVDLIALSTRKRNLFTKLFDSSLTKKMAYHTHVPLLSLHI